MKGTPSVIKKESLEEKEINELICEISGGGGGDLNFDFAGLFEYANDPIGSMDNGGNWDDSGEWEVQETVFDSGAAECVADAGMFPGVEVQESAGSRSGRHFTSATGEEVPNEGEKVTPIVTEQGTCKMMTWQLDKVHKPLTAVGKVCDQDNICAFGKSVGFIRNNETGELTKFSRKNGIYIMRFLMRKGKNKDFRGPGEEE
jgi:hypothetical protein